ncbi:hypothetical protein H9L12_02640 [Sphingomonas rhizophila]|uniref:Calcium-binding protein n=1 Tax=Sphingomonas rhizophila TaxID=2071607 RepID=A0A7G9SCE0_9SPHN|nr:calcium-binding protein [Sphingomonas rhizophila]QNN65515.1 hypothetical protein H9L12_02640 [Sphingomonas rhizophila]
MLSTWASIKVLLGTICGSKRMPVVKSFTDGNDVYSVELDDTYILAFLGGADVLSVWRGAVTASMGDESDLVLIRGGTVDVEGDGGADRFNFYADVTGVDLAGGAGDDRFFGYAHTIGGTIHGDAGDDRFYDFGSLSSSSVVLHGGIGNDIYRVDAAAPVQMVEHVDEGTDTVEVGGGASFTLATHFENLTVVGAGASAGPAVLTGNGVRNVIRGGDVVETIAGLDGNDVLFGKGGNDTLWGGNGDDVLDGGSGDDVLYGEAGNDVFHDGGGADRMVGGSGDDNYFVDSGTDKIVEIGGEGIDTVRSSAADYTLSDNVENGVTVGTAAPMYLRGNALNNILSVSSVRSTLFGMAGDDRLYGAEQGDRLVGGDGNDFLQGRGGNDVLDGGAGSDVLRGGLGFDRLDGGLGSDLYVYFSAEEGAGDVLNFKRAIDVLDLSRIDADTSRYGNQAFTFVDGPTGEAGQLWITYYDRYDGTAFLNRYADIFADIDGDGFADLHLNIDGGLWDDNWMPVEFLITDILL